MPFFMPFVVSAAEATLATVAQQVTQSLANALARKLKENHGNDSSIHFRLEMLDASLNTELDCVSRRDEKIMNWFVLAGVISHLPYLGWIYPS